VYVDWRGMMVTFVNKRPTDLKKKKRKKKKKKGSRALVDDKIISHKQNHLDKKIAFIFFSFSKTQSFFLPRRV